MKLPSRMLDLSSPLENDTVYDPPFMRPKIEYRTNAENAPMLLDNFPGLRREDLPEGEGWGHEPERGEVRRLVCRAGNPFALPAKDRSGRLDVTEPPDLSALLAKINSPRKG